MSTAAVQRGAWWSPYAWGASLVGLWRHSLQFRTVFVTVVLSGSAILVTGLVVSYSVGNDLYQSRLQQSLGDYARALTLTQQKLKAQDSTDSATIAQLGQTVTESVQSATSTRLIALLRVPGQPTSSPFAPPGFTTIGGLSESVISAELRSAVQKRNDELFSQSVALPVNADPAAPTDPGIIVGSRLTLPGAGDYELYLGYDLADSEQTLLFLQRTLLLAGLALIVLIGAIAYVVVRLVVTPIRITAETSRRLAAGDLAVRIPERGGDVFTTLARSFNGMADSLQHQITRLGTLSQLQQRFVSDVSHELRTPLTTIRLASDVIYDQRDSFEVTTARTAELLHTQVERFDLLLSDLLEISRYDAGSVNLELEQTSLVQLAQGVIEELSALAEQNGTRLRLLAPGGYTEVRMDARRVRRIVRNLLGNAIEHGEGKPIDVLVDSNEASVALAVRDHGMGMDESDVGRVFDRFWRADPSRRRTIGGTGLGLAISLEDATIHGGALDVWSRRGAGSCFRLTLPRRASTPMGPSPIPLPPADAEEVDS